jgi:uncharacterized damage-inducible protein DinB
MNPYASYLGDRDPHAVLAESPTQIGALFDKLGTAGAERALAPGKWSARKILCHLADCEVAFAFRLRQTLAEPHHVIQPFDQDAWAAAYSAAALDVASALEAYAALRRWNIKLIESVPAGAMSKLLTHPERGQMTFGVVVETMAGHDLNHLQQIERIAAM